MGQMQLEPTDSIKRGVFDRRHSALQKQREGEGGGLEEGKKKKKKKHLRAVIRLAVGATLSFNKTAELKRKK